MIRYLQIALLLVFSIAIRAQSDSRLMARHLEAQNQAFWDQINSFSCKANFWDGSDQRILNVLVKKPGKIKLIDEKKKFVYATNGSEFWTLQNTNAEVETLSSEKTEMLKSVFDFGSPLKTYRGKLNYLGEVTVDSKLCHWWYFVENSVRREFFVDKDDLLFYKSVTKFEGLEKQVSVSRTISQYRDYQGIVVPAVITIKSTNHLWELSNNEMLLGEGIPSSVFEKPQ